MSSPAAATQVGLEGQVAASVVALVEADQAPILARSFYPAEGSPSPITASLAHVPEVLEATLPFVGRILGPTAIDARTKEIVIVRTSALMECRYCVETHSVVALDCGLSREEVRALRGEGDIEAVFTDPGELALLAWVDAVALGRGAVPEEITARAKGAMGDPELVELTLVAEQIASGAISERLWFYANYHCNLRCTYCLTESAPEVDRREFGREQIIERARQGKGLGFTALGVTGGEPFTLDYMPELIATLGSELPTVVLSNATVFNARRLREMEPLADLPVHVQISLDSPDPEDNDEMRGPANFRKVVEAVPKLVERGIGVRIATTLEDPEAADPREMERLCELHRSLGVPDEDHIVRPIINRGRAQSNEMGVLAGFEQLDPELTLTADGAFYSPFGPTVRGGQARHRPAHLANHRASGRARCGAGPDRRGPPGGERRIDRHQVNVMLGRPVGRRIDSQQEKSS